MSTDADTAVNPDDFEQALGALAPKLGAGGRAITGLRRLSGGASQEIWRFDLVSDAGAEPLILRRAPGGGRVSETAVGLEIEARLLETAAAAGVPVPPVRHVLTPEDGVGRGFIEAGHPARRPDEFPRPRRLPHR